MKQRPGVHLSYAANLSKVWGPPLSHQQTTVAGSSFSDSTSGIADISLGAKWHTVDGEGGRPSQAWLFHVDLATASSLFGGEGARPSVRFTAEWELTHGFGVGVMPGLVWERDERGRYLRGVLGAVLGKNFTATFKGFAELTFRQIASTTHGGDVVSGDLGVAGLIGTGRRIYPGFLISAFGNRQCHPNSASPEQTDRSILRDPQLQTQTIQVTAAGVAAILL